jgi:hypothetical protein
MQINEATFVSLFKHARNLCIYEEKRHCKLQLLLSLTFVFVLALALALAQSCNWFERAVVYVQRPRDAKAQAGGD